MVSGHHGQENHNRHGWGHDGQGHHGHHNRHDAKNILMIHNKQINKDPTL